MRFLNWIDARLSKGVYFPILTKILSAIEKLSLDYWLKEYLKRKGLKDQTGRKAPKWASELYQFIFFVIAIVAFLSIKWLISIKLLRIIVFALFIYRVLDIFIFVLNWVFVHEVDIHSYRRSLAGFLLNLIEVALYFTVLGILSNCLLIDANQYDLLYSQFINIFTLGVMYNTSSCQSCKILLLTKFLISKLLILIVLASLVGGLLREEGAGNK